MKLSLVFIVKPPQVYYLKKNKNLQIKIDLNNEIQNIKKQKRNKNFKFSKNFKDFNKLINQKSFNRLSCIHITNGCLFKSIL